MPASKPCGAVFRADENAWASCALRFNPLGPHRDWRQVADDRSELAEVLEDLLLVMAPGMTTLLDHEKDKARALLSRTKAGCLAAATRFVAPKQFQPPSDTAEGQGKSKAPGGKSSEAPGKSVSRE